MKTAAEAILTAVLMRRLNPVAFIKAAADVGTPGVDWQQKLKDILREPVAQYGLAGAGVGGLGSILRSMFGKPDEDIEGGAVERFLKSTALGGLAGSGLAGGAHLLGAKLPTLGKVKDSVLDAIKPTSVESRPRIKPDWGTSAGVGALGALGTGAGALAWRNVLKNRALSTRLLPMLTDTESLGGLLSNRALARLNPTRAADVGRRAMQHGGLARQWAARGKGIRGSATRRALGESDLLQSVRNLLTKHTDDAVAGRAGMSVTDAAEARRMLDTASREGLEKTPLDISTNPWGWATAGGIGSGLLHQGLGSQPDV